MPVFVQVPRLASVVADRGLCLELVLLSEQEFEVVRGLTGTSVRGGLLECVLEAEHGLEHAAPAVGPEGPTVAPAWWLRWWPGRRVLEAVPCCGAVRSDEEEMAELGAECSSPAGHEGGHSFDLDRSARPRLQQ